MLTRVVHPDFETVLPYVELGDELFRRHSVNPDGINLRIRSHKSDVGGPFPDSFLVDYHLLGRVFLEHIEGVFRISGQTAEGVLHIVFHQFRQGVTDFHARSYQGIKKCNPVRLRVIFIVAVLVLDRIETIYGVLNIPYAEKAPVVSLCGGNGTLEENCRIRLVLVEHHSGPLDRLERVAVLHCSGNHHRINAFSRGKDISVAREHIALVIVSHCSGEVQSVGAVTVQV